MTVLWARRSQMRWYSRQMIKKGDIVQILADFRDPGDEDFTWVALGDEEKGRIDIKPVDHPMRIKPIYTLGVDQVRSLPAAPAPDS